jgi:hypothetical protein
MAVLQRSSHGGSFSVSVAFDAASVAANITANQAITVPGILATDDVLMMRPPTLNAGLMVQVASVAADTVTVAFGNMTAGALDPGSLTYTFIVFRH